MLTFPASKFIAMAAILLLTLVLVLAHSSILKFKSRDLSQSSNGKQGVAGATAPPFCYMHVCTCTDTVADCSGNHGALVFIPELPKDISFLNFSYNDLVAITNDNFFLNVTSVEGVELSFNQLVTFNPQAFRPVEELRTLYLNGNKLPKFPDTCSDGNSLFPRLEILQLNQNSIQSVPELMCLPELKELWMNSNRINYVQPDAFLHLDNLEYLTMSENFQCRLADNAFRSPSLRKLSLVFNFLDFTSKAVSADAFSGCANLEYLLLSSYNSFRGISGDKMLRLFGPLASLTFLDLTNVQLELLPVGVFHNMSNLTTLYLSENRLKTISDGTFDEATALTILDLSRNELSVVLETTFSAATRSRLRHLDLSGNPFTCSCQDLFFPAWLLAQSALFHSSSGSYDCGNDYRTNLTFFVKHECRHSPSTLAPTSSGGTDTAVWTAVLLTTFLPAAIVAAVLWRLRRSSLPCVGSGSRDRQQYEAIDSSGRL